MAAWLFQAGQPCEGTDGSAMTGRVTGVDGPTGKQVLAAGSLPRVLVSWALGPLCLSMLSIRAGISITPTV